jgi:hypothetical protein
MVEKRPSNGRSASEKAGSGRRNAAALSAALRENLQRRKARERALRAKAQTESTPESPGEASQTGEDTWTK